MSNEVKGGLAKKNFFQFVRYLFMVEEKKYSQRC